MFPRRCLGAILMVLCLVQEASNQGQPIDPSRQDPSKFPNSNNAGDRTDLLNQNIPESSQLEYYLDSQSDCSPVVRQTGDKTVTVYGRGASQSGASPLECRLTIRVDQPRDPKKYKISLLEMDIRDCNVNFFVYDGTTSQSLLGRYSCPQNSGSDFPRVLWTSGNIATFYIKRNSRENTLYSIQLQIQTIRANTDWETEWPQNPDYNRFYKFQQKWIVLIAGVGYAVITVMVTMILLICCCCIRQDGKKWQNSRFGLLNPALNGSGAKIPLNNSYLGTKPRQSTKSSNEFQRGNSLRKAPVDVKKRMAGGSEDIDSVFESDGTTGRQNRLPANSVRQRNSPPVIYGPNGHRKPVQNLGRKTDDTFVQADDDHPQNMFVEREIIIPAKKKPKRPKKEEYSSEEEDYSSGGEEIEKVSSAVNTDPEMKDGEVQYSDPAESDSEDSKHSEDEVSADYVPESSVSLYAKPNKRAKTTEQAKLQTQAPLSGLDLEYRRPRTPLGDLDAYQPQGRNIPQQPHSNQPHRGYGYQGLERSPYGQQKYGQSSNQPRYTPQPQYEPAPTTLPYAYYGSEVPSQPMGHDQSYLAPPSYQTSGQYPRYTPEPYNPPYEDNQYHPRGGARSEPRSYPPTEAAPHDPPIYSYLVRRGYNPVDPTINHSPASSHHSLENRLGPGDDTLSANIDSGVEIMRR